MCLTRTLFFSIPNSRYHSCKLWIMPIPNPRLNSRTLRVRPLHRTTSATFIHAPLNHPRNFRILHLKNSLRGDSEEWKDQVLHGTLVENSLDDVPLYLALSYAWGDPSLSDVILIDERELKITQSCGAALRRMLKGNSEIMIWVDAICINQAGMCTVTMEFIALMKTSRRYSGSPRKKRTGCFNGCDF
jgi:hypothetical protein